MAPQLAKQRTLAVVAAVDQPAAQVFSGRSLARRRQEAVAEYEIDPVPIDADIVPWLGLAT